MQIVIASGPVASDARDARMIAMIAEAGFHGVAGVEGLYEEWRERATNTFGVLQCPSVVVLQEHAASHHAPNEARVGGLLRELCDAALSGGCRYVAVLFASEWDDEEIAYRSGSPADLERMLALDGPRQNRLKVGARGGERDFWVQEIDELPLIFDINAEDATSSP